MSQPGLVEVELPPPAEMVRLWARLVDAAGRRGFPQDATGDGETWHYAPGTGDWADLRLLPDGRALLLGYDDVDVTTYFRESARFFGEPETDLLAGAPAWWDEVLAEHYDGLRGERVAAQARWVTFVLGWDGSRWWRAAPAPDATRVAEWPIASEQECDRECALPAPGGAGARPARELPRGHQVAVLLTVLVGVAATVAAAYAVPGLLKVVVAVVGFVVTMAAALLVMWPALTREPGHGPGH